MHYLKYFVLFTLAACVSDNEPVSERRFQYLLPSDDFIITVKTDNPGITPPTQFTIPTSDEAIYNYDVDCNDDGVNEAINQSGDYTCDYAPLGGSGTYTIRIKNNFPRPVFMNINPDKLISVEQWGTQQWTGLLDAFRATRNLSINAIDTPDLTNITSLEGMFRSSGVGNGTGNWNWDTSNITNLKNMFRLATHFNKDVGTWDVSKVTNMEGLFVLSRPFNSDIGSWDVSQVTNMFEMFGATDFNQDIGMWDVSAVENMGRMFGNADKFNQDIGGWDVSKVTNFTNMFQSAQTFNQNIEGWDVSAGIDFGRMFRGTTAFDQNLSSWNMSNAENVVSMMLGSGLSTHNYDSLLTGWSSRSLKPNLIFTNDIEYCTGETARNYIINTFNWIIDDYGKDCSVLVEMADNSEDDEGLGDNLPMVLVLGTTEIETQVVVSDSRFGSARKDFDYRFSSPQTVTIPAGTYDGTRATAIAIPTLEILDDDIVEEDETIQLSVSQPTTQAELKDANRDGIIFTLSTYTIKNDDVCTSDAQCFGLQVCNLKQIPAQCAEPNICGNGTLDSTEFCDDGNLEIGDGCNENCKVENGNPCAENAACQSATCDLTEQNPLCEPVDTCGNSVVESDEICDDGNTSPNDGCDENCELEDNIECDADALCASGICDQSTSPGRCESANTCGNNIVENEEECDDGGTTIGDGCDSSCALEDALNCVGDRNCPEGLVCTDGVCGVECRSNIDCEKGDCIFGQCIECTENTDCQGSDQCVFGRCESGCTNNDECAPAGFCDDQCVECLNDEHCLENETCEEGSCDDPDRCDPNLERCENACVSNMDCQDARIPFCDTNSSTCGECNENQDCEGGEICIVSGTANRCEPGCTSESCGDEICGDDGLCLECADNEDCESGRCKDSKCIPGCESDSDCLGDHKKCDIESNVCVPECIDDSDCFLGRCVLETSTCEVEDDSEEPTEVIDDGCGCASNSQNIPLTPSLFILSIVFAAFRRRAKKALS